MWTAVRGGRRLFAGADATFVGFYAGYRTISRFPYGYAANGHESIDIGKRNLYDE